MSQIIIINFGTVYLEKIASKINEIDPTITVNIVDWNCFDIDAIDTTNTMGIILSGSPDHVYNMSHSTVSTDIFNLNIPILGICYGMQLIVHLFGGEVKKLDVAEFGVYDINVDNTDDLFSNLPNIINIHMRHFDGTTELDNKFQILAGSSTCISAIKLVHPTPIYGVQFHPEIDTSDISKTIFTNFINICVDHRSCLI